MPRRRATDSAVMPIDHHLDSVASELFGELEYVTNFGNNAFGYPIELRSIGSVF